MHVSDWPKRPNMVSRPNLGDDSIFYPPPWSTPKAKVYSLVPIAPNPNQLDPSSQ